MHRNKSGLTSIAYVTKVPPKECPAKRIREEVPYLLFMKGITSFSMIITKNLPCRDYHIRSLNQNRYKEVSVHSAY